MRVQVHVPACIHAGWSSVEEKVTESVVLTTMKGLWKANQRALIATTAMYNARRVMEHRKWTNAG